MGSRTKQLTLLLPVWTRCSSAIRLCLRAAGNNLDVLGGAAVDLVGVVLGSGVSSSSGVLPHMTALPCGRLHPGRSGSTLLRSSRSCSSCVGWWRGLVRLVWTGVLAGALLISRRFGDEREAPAGSSVYTDPTSVTAFRPTTLPARASIPAVRRSHGRSRTCWSSSPCACVSGARARAASSPRSSRTSTSWMSAHPVLRGRLDHLVHRRRAAAVVAASRRPRAPTI